MSISAAPNLSAPLNAIATKIMRRRFVSQEEFDAFLNVAAPSDPDFWTASRIAITAMRPEARYAASMQVFDKCRDNLETAAQVMMFAISTTALLYGAEKDNARSNIEAIVNAPDNIILKLAMTPLITADKNGSLAEFVKKTMSIAMGPI